MGHGNPQNLIKPSEQTPEERHAAAVRAGKASAKARQKYKAQKEILKRLLATELPDEQAKIRKELKKLGLDLDFAEGINLAAAKKALLGDIEAARYIRDTIGEKPVQGVEIGNLDDKPLETLDLSKMTDDQLKTLAARRMAAADDD